MDRNHALTSYHRRPVTDTSKVSAVSKRNGNNALVLSHLDSETCCLFTDDLTKTEVAVNHRKGFRLKYNINGLTGANPVLGDVVKVKRCSNDTMRIMTG